MILAPPPQGIPATVDGMLGGFGNISSTDIAGSKNFLLPFIEVRWWFTTMMVFVSEVEFHIALQGSEAVIKPHRALGKNNS